MRGKRLQRCPECDESIESAAINIQEGVALCPMCGTLSRLSELNNSDRCVQEILAQPPSGCSIDSLGNVVIVTASTRSIGGFMASVALSLFWNGIVSVFVLIALAGLYTNLVGPLPDWFPASEMNQGKPEMNGKPMELGETLFLCVFLTPFVTIGAIMIAAAMLSLVGKVEVIVKEYESYVATGIAFVRWKRRFDPHQVRSVTYATTTWRSEDGPSIVLAADRTIKFGSLLQSERAVWLRAVLTELLLHGHDDRHGSSLPQLPWPDRDFHRGE